MEVSLADIILFKGVSHTALPVLAPREPAVAFDPMTGDAKLWIGTTVGNELVSGGTPGPPGPTGGTGLFASDYGVSGTSGADQSANVQASVTAALAGNRSLLNLPPGVINLSAPLTITGTAGVQASGVSLQGAGVSANTGPLGGGTVLHVIAANQDSAVRVGVGFFVGQKFSDFSIRGHGQDNDPRDTAIGVHWAETQWTMATCTNLSILHVGTAFQEDFGSGNADGESLALIQCRAGDVDCFLRNNAGQAYGNTVVGGGATVNNGGTVFDFPYQGGGCNFGIYEFSCSFPAPQVSNTLLNVTALEGPGAIRDIRAEKVGTIIKYGAGSANVRAFTVIEGGAFPGMPDGARLFFGAAGANQVKLIFRHCQFEAQVTNHTYALNGLLSQWNQSSIVFEDCDFMGWGPINLSAKPVSPPSTTDPPFGVTLVRCRRDTGASGQVLVDFSN